MSMTTSEQHSLSQNIRDRADIIHSAWLARPTLDSPKWRDWERKCRVELSALKDLLRRAKDPIPVPLLVLAYLRENNLAVREQRRDYNYEAFNPDNTLPSSPPFLRDEAYKPRIRTDGWWDNVDKPDGTTDNRKVADNASRPSRALVEQASGQTKTGKGEDRAATPAQPDSAVADASTGVVVAATRRVDTRRRSATT
ncbi:hypothetical protein L226DRAFT_571627 [Lentinus tigrinus ALCF2SS1-7]|uniref:uncharacterized protein n=1 Tax=Lentinus tigrinus ALCF2SS1-7 TaxID=1328758 RepID=UPI001165D1FE|nr:hypothetical protein L226DRAFT_571627 [Lentinus tigrinus ALCF2SS1-7]